MASRSGTPTPVNPILRGRDLTALLLILWLAWLFPFPAGAESRERMTVPNSATPGQAGNAATRARLLKTYGAFPLSFEANQGQTDARVKFLSRGRGYSLFLTPTESVLTLRKPAPHQDAKSEIRNPKRGAATPNPGVQPPTVLRMKLTGANPTPRVTGVEELPGKSNYFIGNDPTKWHSNVPNYAKVQYKNIYPGIDLVYYGNQQQLEYDFVVAPGADPRAIRLAIETGESKSANPGSQIRVEANGDLVIHLEGGDVRFRKPVVYQPRERRQWSVVSGQSRPTTDDGQRTTGSSSEFTIQNSELVDGHYVLTAANEIRFEVPTYDRKRPLIIDPVLSYSTFLGGTQGDEGFGIAVDSSGNAYVTGSTYSVDFPVQNPLQEPSQNGDAFLTKLNAQGSGLIYSTYLGGSSNDSGMGIAVDSSRNAYVTGLTESTDFPTTEGAYQEDRAGEVGADAFVVKLNPTGSELIYSTYLGGSSTDAGEGIAVDASGNAYVTGYTPSSDFPTTDGAYQENLAGGSEVPLPDAFVAKLNPTGSAPVYSTYLGGGDYDYGFGIAVDSSGNAYVTGATNSINFPTTEPAYQPNPGGESGWDAFVVKLNPTGSAPVYSTYLGGSNYDDGRGIAVDSSGNAYVTGETDSIDFPTTENAYQPDLAGENSDAFVVKLNAIGSGLVYSTYLGGSSNGEGGQTIALDASGNAYVAGWTQSSDFPTASPIQASNAGGTCEGPCPDAFVAKLNAPGSALIFSTYLGGADEDQANGIAVDPSGNAYVTGTADSAFPTTPGAFQPEYGGGYADAFVAKLSGLRLPLVSLSPQAVEFSSLGVGFTSDPETVTLTNIGDANLIISSIDIETLLPRPPSFRANSAVSSDFFETNDCDTTVTPGQTCTITVTFTPTEIGPRSGKITITDNAAGSPQQIMLFGNGLAAPAVQLLPSSLDFGDQPVGISSEPRLVTLTNNGSVILQIESITATGHFSRTHDCPVGLAVEASCPIEVTFRPTALGQAVGAVHITDNGPGSPQAVPLTGNGIPAPTTTVIDAPTVTYGSNASVTVTVTSDAGTVTGNVSLSVDGGIPILQALTGGSTTFTLTSPSAGDHSLSANYAAQDVFAASSASGTLHVNKADQTITVSPAAPATAVYNTTFPVAATASSGLTVSIGVSGVCSLSGGTVTMTSGTGTCTVTFSQAGNPNYNAATPIVENTTAAKATPVITWSNPTDIVYGTALGDMQLNATASFNGSSPPGVFTYTPLAGTILTAGSNQTLSVTFTPNDTTNFNTATATVQLNVNTKGLTITANNASRAYGTANPAFTASYSGFVNGENSSVLGGTLSCTTAATPTSPVTGSPYPITCSGQTSTNYAISYVDGQLTVTKATPTFGNLTASQIINWGTASIMLSGTIAAGSVSPPAGESVAITINGASQTASIAGSGSFTASFDTHAIPISLTAYTITYSYPGGADFSAASDTGTTLTVQGPLVSLSPTTLTFDTQFIATTSPQQAVTLTNTGNGPLTSPTITTSGDFDQTNNCASGAAPAAHCTINVTFTPTAAGLRTGTLTISDNAPGSPHVVNLTGTGAVGLTLTPSTLEFEGNVDVICPAKEVTVKNVRETPVHITAVTVEGPFNMDTTCRGATLAPGATCLVTVLFLPHEVGTFPGAVRIYTDVTPDPVVLALTGHATPACRLQAASQASTVLRGTGSTTFNIADSNPSCFTSTVNLSCANQSPATCSFSAATIRPTEGAVLTVGNLAAVTANDLSFRVVGTASNHSASVNLVVHLSDFSLAVNSSRATVTAGQSATYDLSLQPVNGLSGRVNLSCTGVPAGATCSVIPASLTMDGATMASFKVKVTTTARSLGAPGPKPQNLPPFFGPWIGLGGVWWLVALALLAGLAGSRRSGRRALLGLTVALLFVLLWAACAGGSFRQTLSTGTPAGTYTLTLSATYPAGQSGAASDLSHSTSLTLLVQ